MSAVINDGDVAWVLASSALVMFMTPGLGFFYGGLVRKQNMITTIAYCFIVYALVTIVWALLGFSLVFAPSANMTGILGNTDWAAMREVGPEPHSFYGPTIPLIVFFFF
jgi:Amt family ammonium transporter